MYDRNANNAYYKSRGICPRCHCRPSEPGKVLCWECAEADHEAYLRKTPEQRKAKQSRDTARKRIIRAERLAKGLCPKCGKRPSVDGGLCKNCRGYLARYREKKRKEQGIFPRAELRGCELCYICGGKRPAMPGKSVCEVCYAQRMKAMEKCWEGQREWLEHGEVLWRRENALIFNRNEGNPTLTKKE